MNTQKIIESLYDRFCNIYIYNEETDETTGVTSLKKELAYSQIKCRISYTTGLFQGSLKINSSSDDNVSAKQYVKIFLPPDTNVPPGSVFEVTEGDKTLYFKNSGRGCMYKNHQEILVESEEEYN